LRKSISNLFGTKIIGSAFLPISIDNNMRISSLVCLLYLSLTTPAVAKGRVPLPAQISAPATTIALSDYPDAFFEDEEWSVGIDRLNGDYNYQGTNKKTGAEMRLSNGIVSGPKSRRVYTWNNKGTKYRITWQPTDRAFIRVQAFDGRGKEILNRLLTVVSP
jgi:hypothetical protein